MSTADQQISYNTAEAYWSTVEPSVDGMLGGFAHLAPIDIRDSVKVLQVLKDEVGPSWLTDWLNWR
jgi:protein N-terminal methyltransferase